MKCKHPILTKTKNFKYATILCTRHNLWSRYRRQPYMGTLPLPEKQYGTRLEYFEEILGKWPHYRGHANANTCNHELGTYL